MPCRLVRGAYMVSERQRAAELGYDDPIHATLEDTHLGEDEMREVIEYLETKEIEACGTPAYKDPAARALKAGVLIVWDPDHLQAKRDGKGEVAMEEVERGRVVRVEMEDVASGLEWTQIGVYMPVRGQGIHES